MKTWSACRNSAGAGALFLLAVSASEGQLADKSREHALAIPMPTFRVPAPYSGSQRVALDSVTDRRAAEDIRELGFREDGFRYTTEEPAVVYVERAFREGLTRWGLLASRADQASLLLGVELLELNLTIPAGATVVRAYAEVVCRARLAAGPRAAPPFESAREVLIRSFRIVYGVHVSAEELQALLAEALGESVERLISSRTLASFIEEGHRSSFRIALQSSEDLPRWLKELRGWREAAPSFESEGKLDLTAFDGLQLGDIRVVWESDADDTRVWFGPASGLYRELLPLVRKKFHLVDPDSASGAGHVVVLDFSAQLLPPSLLRPSRREAFVRAILRRGESGNQLAVATFETRTRAPSYRIQLRIIAERLAEFLCGAKPAERNDTVEWSWAEG